MTIRNQTAYTHDCIIEFNKTFRRKTRRLINILCLIAIGALVFFLFSQCLLFLMGEDPYLSPTMIAAMIVLLIIYIGYSTVVPITVKRTARKQADQESVVDYIFTEEGFEQSTVSKALKEQQQCGYSVIVKVTESEHYFYLFIAPNAAHIVSKTGFTEGNEDDFRTLLRTVIDPKKLHID